MTVTKGSRWRVQAPGMTATGSKLYPAGTILEVISVGDPHILVKVKLIDADHQRTVGRVTYDLGTQGETLPVHRDMFDDQMLQQV